MATSRAPPFVLKFKGNKTFSAFTGASIAEEENLWVLHSVVTKVAQHLEEGERSFPSFSSLTFLSELTLLPFVPFFLVSQEVST